MEGGEGPVAALAATGEEKCCTVGQAVLAAGLRLHAGRTRVVAVGFGEAAGDPEGAVHVDDLVSCVAALGATPQDEDTSGRAPTDGSAIVVLVSPRSAGDTAGLDAVLGLAARHPSGIAVLLPPCRGACGAAADPGRPDGGEPADEVEVSVLGPVEVRGVEGWFARRPKLTELVVYLAMHPEGATTRTWSTALWPDRCVPPQTIANRLSEARRALGFAPDGRARLRRNGERHQLVAVATDWERFGRLAAAERGPAGWRAALELVRGRPFDELQQGQWTTFEGVAAEIEQAVVEAALRLGGHLLEGGDADGAAWASQKGLKASPWDERLHRLLMRAADAAGNRAGVEAILRHLALVLEIDGDPLRGVHPETAALYERLRGSDGARAHV